MPWEKKKAGSECTAGLHYIQTNEICKVSVSIKFGFKSKDRKFDVLTFLEDD